MNCMECGKDVGQDGVLTVMLVKHVDGRIESRDIRLCRACVTEKPVSDNEETER